MTGVDGIASAPLLRTLAPLLRGLDGKIRTWLDTPHLHKLTSIQQAEIEGIADDLKRKAEALDVDQPVLVIMLMGGTGVGKSTLLNALAGAPVAQASYTRPTTRDPVVYYHRGIPTERLDPAILACRLVQHDRDPLAQKIIIDTPDLDSNDLDNRERLKALLPVADVVLYVGSQEKYHDQLGWELFKEQRQRRAFAFVLNKWDRCSERGTIGLRPDEDLLRDLQSEGFTNPRIFRTTAQLWLDHAESTLPRDLLPDGEQFNELVEWLESGLTRLDIEAVKARGVSQLLAHSVASIAQVQPPDVSPSTRNVTELWQLRLEEEAEAVSSLLLGALDPYRHEVEHHFSTAGQQRFRGIMAAYLRMTTKLRFAGSTLRDRVPLSPRFSSGKSTPVELDLMSLAYECGRTAGERVLTQRSIALANRLLVEADREGFPLQLLNDKTTNVARADWPERLMHAVIDALGTVEREAAEPRGWQRYVRKATAAIANYLPETVLMIAIIILLWRFIVEDFTPQFFHVLLPIYVTLGVLVVLHIIITFVFPVRWGVIRNAFQKKLETRVQELYEDAYMPIPEEIAEELSREREQIQSLITEIEDVMRWLAQRESAATIQDLYGTTSPVPARSANG